MPNAVAKPKAEWLVPALWIVAVVTICRLVLLAFDHTDLFVDETQYWLWGQRLDFGYYSKPPLIGWVIRLVTELAGSSDPFWVRMPGALFHGATALILAALAARIAGRGAAIWTAALYVTLPFTAVGTIMISTDTIMAPFFAAALLFFWRAGEDRRALWAVLAGAMIGMAFMAKYAAIYFWIGAALAMIAVPSRRIGWRNVALMAVAFLVVVSPNVIWNLTHKLATVEHTMDNVGWVRGGARLNWGSMAEFVGSQFGVFGPVAMVALLIGYAGKGDRRALALLSVPPLVAVTVQALLGKAYANWAVAAYFAGVVLAVLVLPRWARWAALALNLIVVVTIPVLTVLAPWPEVHGKPILNRYLGRAELSARIVALAKANDVPILASDRDILADLFYTGRDAGVTIYAPATTGRPRNYYEQNFALPDDYTGSLLVIRDTPMDCGAGNVPPAGLLNPSGVWSGRSVLPYVVSRECLGHEN